MQVSRTDICFFKSTRFGIQVISLGRATKKITTFPSTTKCFSRICGNFQDYVLSARKIGHENNYKVEGVTSGCLTFSLMCSATKADGEEQYRLAALSRKLCREYGPWVRHRD